jgi:YggT family protein
MQELVQLLDVVYRLLNLLIIIRVIISWIPGIGVNHPAVRVVHQLTSPILDPIRRLMPAAGGLDLSPMIAIVLLYLVRNLLVGALLGL